jgi:hypothetical protein
MRMSTSRSTGARRRAREQETVACSAGEGQASQPTTAAVTAQCGAMTRDEPTNVAFRTSLQQKQQQRHKKTSSSHRNNENAGGCHKVRAACAPSTSPFGSGGNRGEGGKPADLLCLSAKGQLLILHLAHAPPLHAAAMGTPTTVHGIRNRECVRVTRCVVCACVCMYGTAHGTAFSSRRRAQQASTGRAL